MAGMTIFLTRGGQDPVAVDLSPDATVGDLAEEAARFAQNGSDILLTFQGQELNDLKQALSDLGIGPETRVDVSCRALGWHADLVGGAILFRHPEFGTVVEFVTSSNGWWRFVEGPNAGGEEALEGIMVWSSSTPADTDTQSLNHGGDGARDLAKAAADGHPKLAADLWTGSTSERFGMWLGFPAPWGSTWCNKDTANQAILFMSDGVRWYNGEPGDAHGVEVARDGRFAVLSEEAAEELRSKVYAEHPEVAALDRSGSESDEATDGRPPGAGQSHRDPTASGGKAPRGSAGTARKRCSVQ
eukprot:TRINITY_DN7968_c0_g2_i2.p1 TRINITY_DN7968_c0_g2~~TRINITY_DN7968_c0_g2_i2.p1  ORF type:complete len:301 (+),score=34.89 TRINITY_DN7968_c0_g2_i2:87-989(+)